MVNINRLLTKYGVITEPLQHQLLSCRIAGKNDFNKLVGFCFSKSTVVYYGHCAHVSSFQNTQISNIYYSRVISEYAS